MQFEGGRRSSHVPNLTPLIDIVFLLLIFFMLTSHFVREDALDIQLPEAESGHSLDDKKALKLLSMHRVGGYTKKKYSMPKS